MISLKQCFKHEADPWGTGLKCYRLEGGRFGEDALGMSEEEKDKKKTASARAKEVGKNAYENVDHTLSKEDKKRKETLAKGLQLFQEKTGIDESKYIKQVEEAKTNGELSKLEKKFNEAANKFYANELEKSGAFLPIHGKEARFLKAEKDYLKDKFAECALFKEGKLNKVDILSGLKENLKPRLKFREKLRLICEKNPMIRDEYFSYFDDQLSKGEASFLELKGNRLDKIMEEIKEVEDSPTSVQNEFRKLQKNRAGKDTATIKKEVLDNFNKRTTSYNKRILENEHLFGGEKIVTPHGKIREAASEFMTWFEELESFATMDNMAGALDKVLAERTKVYEKRDSILKRMDPKEAEKIKDRTDRMRFHNFKAYLPELESKVGKTNIQVLEYNALLEDAEANHISLFTNAEKIKMKNQMMVADADLQKAKLTILEKELIPERASVVNRYFDLPNHLRSDKTFMDSDYHDREKMLRDSVAQLQREAVNPFDLSNLDNFDSEAEEMLLDRIEGERGQAILNREADGMDQQGRLKIGKVQGELYKKVFGVSKHMEETGMTQKEAYLEDMSLWMRRSKNLWKQDVDDADNERDKWQIEALKEDRIMYDMKKVRTSGGEILDLNVISREELDRGGDDTLEKIHKARYPQHLLLLGQDGKDELNVADAIEDKFMMFAKRMLQEYMSMMGAQMHLGEKNRSNYINSPNIRKAMGKMLIEEQFGQYFNRGGANNTDNFINEIAA